ncbi:hypothetical protein [Paracoccus litorisediminis]|uniref:ParG protein n=1 Tax=Paracoccus litorisediminis TaxID=2006130 RepID=A0A844HUC8_9RHOB|nr:hypothetical protein [Paracoccus litorisediminis]MTH61181.1 hypothetical protein [Paracoccus litorisediminis]
MSEENPFKVRQPAKVTDLGTAPEASDNLPSKRIISMTFNMPEDWHTRFKVEAATRGITMRQLFEDCWDSYVRERRGGRP